MGSRDIPYAACKLDNGSIAHLKVRRVGRDHRSHYLMKKNYILATWALRMKKGEISEDRASKSNEIILQSIDIIVPVGLHFDPDRDPIGQSRVSFGPPILESLCIEWSEEVRL